MYFFRTRFHLGNLYTYKDGYVRDSFASFGLTLISNATSNHSPTNENGLISSKKHFYLINIRVKISFRVFFFKTNNNYLQNYISAFTETTENMFYYIIAYQSYTQNIFG